MRVEGVAPRTWLLATVAGWALSLWLLALLGLGGRIEPLPDDPSLNKPLPQLTPAAPERLGPLAQYNEIGARPLFSEDRRPQPFTLQPEGEGEAEPVTFDYVLTSVLLAPGLRMAIVQPTNGGESIRIKLGQTPDEAPAWRLVALNPRSAIFQGPDGERVLDLRTFDGSGGEAPTTMRPQPPPPTATTIERPGQQGPAEVDPGVVQPTAPKPPAAVKGADTTLPNAQPVITPEAQIDAIRKRIEARRAQLRQQAQQPPPPAPQERNP